MKTYEIHVNETCNHGFLVLIQSNPNDANLFNLGKNKYVVKLPGNKMYFILFFIKVQKIIQ